MQRSNRFTLAPALLWPALFSAVLLTTACSRTDDGRTAGESPDTAVAQAERQTERQANEAVQGTREAGRDVAQAMGQATDAVANKAKDAAITTEINARLARDPALSALAIDVDTDGGRVVLRGNAPDTAARGRATELAGSVDGVVAVDNELKVQPGK